MKTPRAIILACALLGAAGVHTLLPREATPPPIRISTSDILAIKGELPQGEFAGVVVPACLECNDYTRPLLSAKRLQKEGVPYALVICGSPTERTAQMFGPTWPVVVAVPERVASGAGILQAPGVIFDIKREGDVFSIARRSQSFSVGPKDIIPL